MKQRIMVVCERIRAASGVSRAMRVLFQQIDRERFEPLLCQFAPDTTDEVAASLNAQAVSARMQQCDNDFHRWDYRFVLKLARTIRQEKISLLHSNCLESLWYGAAVKLMTGVRLLHSEHRSAALIEGGRGRVMRRLVNCCDAFMVVSRDQGEALCRTFGLDENRVALIHNGVDMKTFRPCPVTRAEVRRELGISEDVPLLLGVGRLAEAKNFPLMLRSMDRLLAKRPECKLVIAGDGPQRDLLEKMVRDLNMLSRVRLLGARTDVPRLLAAADLFVSTSDGEAFSYAWLEALSSGVPIVGTRVGGAGEMVQDGVTGRLIGTPNADMIAAAMLEMLVSPERRNEIGIKARGHVERHFSMEVMGRKYMHLYDYCLRDRCHREAEPPYALSFSRQDEVTATVSPELSQVGDEEYAVRVANSFACTTGAFGQPHCTGPDERR